MSSQGKLVSLTVKVSEISQGFAKVTGLLIIVMMLGVVVDAVLRGLAGVAIWGVLELSVLLLLTLIYFGIPATQALRENFRVSIFADALPPKIGNFIAWLLLVLQIAVIGMLVWFTWRAAIWSFTREEVSIGLVEIPLWPSRSMVALGLTLFLLQTLMSAIEFWLLGKHPYARDLDEEIRDEIHEGN